MKRFNPDKELNKIRKGNKNKILYSIITLLLIVAVGSTYALYQVRHTNKIVYTTVDKFINKDIILSVKLDDKDESVNEFPTADSGYVYSHTECEKGNITDITWNEEQRSLNMNSKGPDKCTVYFVKSPFHMKSCENKSMADCLLEEGQKFSGYLAFDDPDSNARYYGKDPSNYIWFNCDDYTNPTSKTCERWRIIGSFKNIEKVNADGTTVEQNLVKIRRLERIGNIERDTNNSNNWSESSLQIQLNTNYLSQDDDGSWIINNRDATYKSITNTTKEKIIEQVKWHLGGLEDKFFTAQQFYISERAESIPNGTKSTFNGYIGLIYPSDYGYATSGSGLPDDSTTNREGCLNKELYNWHNTDNYKTNCVKNSWVWDSTASQWSLTPRLSSTSHVFRVDATGHVGVTTPGSMLAVRPTLYLTHDTKINGGDGTYENPYTINVN